MPREPPSLNAMPSWFTCWSTTHVVLSATCAQEAFPDCRGDRGCFKNPFAGVKYCTAFFADCEDAQNRSRKPDRTTGMCYTTCSGETGQVWSWKQQTGSKKGEQPWREAAACLPHSLLQPPTQLCQPRLEALQNWSYLELPVTILSKCTAAQQFR